MPVLFDRDDREILEEIIRLEEESESSLAPLVSSYSSHAEGIIEISADVQLRIAAALYLLLNSSSPLESGKRTQALQRLYHDITSVEKGLRLNAARVLVEIMKEVFVSKGMTRRRLELIRDFREVYTGKHRIVRKQLEKYQLLEIPEDYSQLSFDDNVDNASKLGKKNPSLLILDAWIKGLSRMQVVVRNYITPSVAYELLTSAEILGVEVEIGIELPVFCNNKYVKFVWTPLGTGDTSAFLRFIKTGAIEKLFKRCERVDAYHQGLIINLLNEFNDKVREHVQTEYSITFDELTSDRYLDFLQDSVPNEINLSEFIYSSVIRHNQSSGGEVLIPEMILLKYLKPLSLSVDIDSEKESSYGSIAEGVRELVTLLKATAGNSRITLLTSNLHSWEVPGILYQAKGYVDAVEIFNLRDYTLASEGVIKYGDGRINRFRKAVNERDISIIKIMLSEDISEVGQYELDNRENIVEELQKVRKNIGKLLDRYSAVHIEPSIGSGAAGRGQVFYGMGFVVKQSLKRSAAKIVAGAEAAEHLALPLGCQVIKRVEYLSGGSGIRNYWQRIIAWHNRRTEWVRQKVNEYESEALDSNIYTLTGRFGQEVRRERQLKPGYWWTYMNTDVKNAVKILIGFIPAFLTFFLVADWPVLKYGGGLIWFGITGGRNVFQFVLSAGGFDRKLNLRWGSLVDKKRIAESLMYTGISVPILEYLVRELLLHKLIGIDAAGSPLAVYAVMSGVNGMYISLHNYIRGFPRVAIIGNLFRSVLAVPVSLLISSVLVEGLGLLSVAGVAAVISQWSAVISKTSSDIVACLIEGMADRSGYIRLRHREIRELEVKFLQICERFELLFPKMYLVDIFDNKDGILDECVRKGSGALDELVMFSLDLMYFWDNKPRARKAIMKWIGTVNFEERMLLDKSLNILYSEEAVAGSLGNLGTTANIEVLLKYYKVNQKQFLGKIKKVLRGAKVAAGDMK